MANFSPSKGTEINKIRPCLVISPDIVNQALPNIIAASLTSTLKTYPSRVNFNFKKKAGQIMIDQILTIDKRRLIKVLGTIDDATSKKVYDMIKIYFK